MKRNNSEAGYINTLYDVNILTKLVISLTLVWRRSKRIEREKAPSVENITRLMTSDREIYDVTTVHRASMPLEPPRFR